jgi:hypothetical protein
MTGMIPFGLVGSDAKGKIMGPTFRQRVKTLVARSGMGPWYSLDALNWLFRYGEWFKENACNEVFATREEMYAYTQNTLIGDLPIDYLEFGVYKGDSIRNWAGLNRDPRSRFVGFDSFEGLPEDWKGHQVTMPKGSFDTGGTIPVVDDTRVGFVKGYFQNTLPGFLKGFTPENRLVLHCDADLYSSTLYMLTNLDRIITPGTLLIFDEFSLVLHEFKAFIEYTRSFQRRYRVRAVTSPPFYIQAVIEIVG